MRNDPKSSDHIEFKYALKWSAIYGGIFVIAIAIMYAWKTPGWLGFVPVGLVFGLHVCNHVRQRCKRRSKP